MSAQQEVIRQLSEAEDRMRDRAAFYRACGQIALATGSEWYAARLHRAVIAETTNPIPGNVGDAMRRLGWRA